MGTTRGTRPGLWQTARVGALGVACLALANCNQTAGVDPKYGVSASPRVVEFGQPVPKGGGVYRVGKPYVVAGKTYYPEEDVNYKAEGLASWYGSDFHGRVTANGEVFDMESIAAAHPTLPMPCYVRVTNMANKRSIIVRVNDRGPYHANRVIDVSKKTAELLGFAGHGVARVRVEYVGRAPLEGSDDRKLMATLREHGQQAQAPVQVASAGDKPYMPEFFDSRPMTRGNVPIPSERPYTLGEAGAEPAEAVTTPQPRATVEMAAASRAPSRSVMVDNTPAAPRLTSPVSAYAPARYDSGTGFMSGRGLY